MRMDIRRLTRLTNAFSKKLENLEAPPSRCISGITTLPDSSDVSGHAGNGRWRLQSRSRSGSRLEIALLGAYYSSAQRFERTMSRALSISKTEPDRREAAYKKSSRIKPESTHRSTTQALNRRYLASILVLRFGREWRRSCAVRHPSEPRTGQLSRLLVRVGFYGKTRTEVARYLVIQGLERLVRDGILKLQPLDSTPGGTPDDRVVV